MCTFYRSMNYLQISVRLKILCWEPISIYLFFWFYWTLCDILLSSLLYWSPALILLRIRDLCIHIRIFSNCLPIIPPPPPQEERLYLSVIFLTTVTFDTMIISSLQDTSLYVYIHIVYFLLPWCRPRDTNAYKYNMELYSLTSVFLLLFHQESFLADNFLSLVRYARDDVTATADGLLSMIKHCDGK